VRQQERGQVVVLIMAVMVALLGFTALAVDGGRVYADRRDAQNAADNAALAAALAIINEGNHVSAALSIADINGYNNDGTTNTVTVYYPPTDGPYAGDNEYVQVKIWAVTDTSLIQFVWPDQLANQVEAVARAYGRNSPVTGNAIVTLGNCAVDGGSTIEVTGGGNSGGVQAFGGGIWINSTESGSGCALDPGNTGYGITSDTGINSTGNYSYSGESNLSPVPINTGQNYGKPIDDPLAFLEEPQCSGNSTNSGGVFTPGNINGSDLSSGGTLEPGIYCISGDVNVSGNNSLSGDGVVLYFINGGLRFTGNAGMTISAPTDANCLGTDGDRTASCTYKGIAIFVSRSNSSSIEVRGNGGDALYGMIYAINSTVQARGGGADSNETSVVGQIISKRVEGNGSGSFKVTYDEDRTFEVPPIIELQQ
jgi:Flp pilus assembly protein TadG